LYHDDLLKQAEGLARIDVAKPRQANLRRAVSSAYYAVFHFLVDQSCRVVIGAQHEQGPYRRVLGRAFSHVTMKQACNSFAGGTLKTGAAKGLPTAFSISTPTKLIAAVFNDLQEKRHASDYDLTSRFRRSDVLLLIEQVEDAIEQFQSLGPSNEEKFFLACLWAWSALINR
jgi:hypothetical protein